MIKIYFLFSCLLFSATKRHAQPIQTEGLVNAVFHTDTTVRNTWFKDSTIIIETYIYHSEAENDSVISSGSSIYKYSFLDITTMKVQDYFSFSDTATPLTNYKLQETDIFGWGFNRKNHLYDKFIDSLIPLADSIIDGINYKRLYFDLSGTGWHQKLTYYLMCSGKNNIFSMGRKIDNLNPGCKVTRIQYTDMLTSYTSFTSFKVVRDSLTPMERKVIDKWKMNSRSTVLPLTTLKDAQKTLAKLWHEKHFPGYMRGN